MIETEEYVKTNRQKRQAPKSGIYWCDGCDAALVAIGAKCPKCKWIQGRLKKVTLKKETSA
jgi:predicted RNA-binding protein with PUA domain